MAIHYNSKIPTSGLSLLLDANNRKSVPYQNLLRYTEQWATSPWGLYVGGGSISSMTNNSSSAPDGTATASLFNISTWGTSASIYQDPINTTAGTKSYRMSFYFKAGTYTGTISPVLWFFTGGTQNNQGVTVNVQTGVISGGAATDQSCVSVGNGWYRVSFIATGTDPLNTNNRFEIYHGGAGTIYYWGAQVTDIDAPSNYIKTEFSAITGHGVWYDISGNNNHVSAVNSPTHSNNSFIFNGTSQYFYNTNTIYLPQTIKTIICWTKPDSSGPNDTYTGLVSWGARACPAGSSTAILLSMYTGTTYYPSSAYWCNDYVPNDANTVLNKDQWNMVGIVTRGSGINNTKLFKYNSSGYNFVTGSSSSYTNTFSTSNQDLRIGCTDGAGRFMKGNISTVLVYDHELSSLEMNSIISAFRGRYGV